MAVAVIAMALWLRTTSVPYLGLASLATVLALASLPRARAGRLGLIGAALLMGGVIPAGIYQRRLMLVERQWTAYSRQVAESGIASLRTAVEHEALALRRVATGMLAAPAEAGPAFTHAASTLGTLPAPQRGVVLFRDTSPVAWAGDIRVAPDDFRDSIGVRVTTFYVALMVSTSSGTRAAVATSVVHAEPPADRLAPALDRRIPQPVELRGFDYRLPAFADSTWSLLRAGSQPLVYVRPVLLSQGEARLRLVERARVAGGLGLAAALVFLFAAAWRRPATLGQRLATILLGLGVTALVPFNTYSNVSRIFDPAVYFAPLGGPLTASVTALALTAGLSLLGCLALARARVGLSSRWIAVLAVAVVASLGPFLLRNLARGITIPADGVTPSLWLAWQVALFLAASVTLLVGAGAGRVAIAGERGLPPALAPIMAAVAAALAPLLWQAPGRWPTGYTGLWIAAMACLALSRRSRSLILNVGIVAACGAATLMWGAISRKRVELAQADVAQLSVPAPSTTELLERLADRLESAPPPRNRDELLWWYVRSPLAAAGHPIELAIWLPNEDRPSAALALADFQRRAEGERALVAEARERGGRTLRTEQTSQGTQTLLAVPHPGGVVTTVVLAPKTRLIPEDPFTALIGLAPVSTTEPPYEINVTTLPSPVLLTTRPQWVRRGTELHGDWLVPGATDSARVHVEVELRGLDVLLPRGALIVLFDLVLLCILWTLAVAADGGLARWGLGRARRWSRSYRGRLTVTLFAFFVIPAGGFAYWSYRRVQVTDRDSRVLLIRETLRTVTSASDAERLDSLSERFDTPLFEYRGGALHGVSDSLYASLAPIGRFLPRPVAIDLVAESELFGTARQRVAGTDMLLGFRTVVRHNGEREVLGAPARTNEQALDRQRRDIGMLVLFVTSLGALAALWLSGLAARELERPVGALRRAALRIARGERYPGPDAEPAVEFRPVFTAFERMDADLAASRAALEAAQRRTEAVLRDVASGVVATDRDGAVTLANPRAEGILGRRIAPGMTLADVGAVELHERTVRFLAAHAETEAFNLQVGDRQLQGSLTRLARAIGGAVLTLDDVTDLAHAQRVLAWGEMARQVAHEIKNPLTPMRLGVQHLQRARRDHRVDFDRVLDQNANRILAEIDRLDEIARAFSRYGMEPAERELAPPERVDVAAVVRDVVELERIGVSDIGWHLSGVDDAVPALARGSELRDVLLNLLENARQAHARNVTVAVARRDGRVALTVADDGDGIPADILPKIFEPRFSTRTSGSGLGLAISRGLVTSWGGEMTVSSERGKGTAMTITLKTEDR